MERLDWVLANGEWNRIFPRAQCIHGIAIGSDHAPIHLMLDLSDRRGRKSFKFEEMWLEKIECYDVIKSAWSRGGRLRRAEEYNHKIRACRIDLTKWSKLCFGNNRTHIESTRKRLHDITSSRPNAESVVEEQVLKSKLHALWKNE